MALKDLFSFGKTQQIDTDLEPVGALFREDGLDRVFSNLSNQETPEKLIQKLGGRGCLKKMLQDDEICTAFNTRSDAIVGSGYSFEAESQELEDFVKMGLGECLPQIIADSMNAIKYGFSVNELVWGMSDDGVILDRTCLRDLEDFEVDKFGQLLIRKTYKDTVPVAQGKYLLTRNRPDALNPYGESLLLKLYYPYQMRRHGYDFWIKFLEKFGNPILYGKVPYEKDSRTGKSSIQLLAEVLSSPKRPSGIATKVEGDIKLLSPNSQGVQFDTFLNSINKRIQKVVLGQTMTTDNTANTGSFAMAKVHDNVREDKRQADIRMIEGSINRLVKYFLWLNDIDKEVSFKITQEKGLGTERSQRDQILKQCGVDFTPQYFERNYDLKEGEDFDLSEGNQVSDIADTFNHACGIGGKFNDPSKEERALEANKELYISDSDSTISPDFFRDIIDSAESKEELIELLSVLPDEDTQFIETLTEAMMETRMQGRIDAQKRK